MKKSLLLAGVAISVVGASLFGCSSTELSNDTLVVGMEVNYAPFNWGETEENEYTLPVSNVSGLYADGYDIQITKRLGEILGKDVTIVRTEWESLITDLQNNVINVVIAGMTDTEERRAAIDFTDEYYRSELVLVTQADVASEYEDTTLSSDELASLLNGQILVSQSSTVTNDIIDIFVESYGATKANPLESFASCAVDVSNGSVFAMTAEYPVAQSIVLSNDNLGIIHIDQDILGDSLSELGVSIGIKKGNTELQDDLNSALAQIDQDERDELMTEAVIRSGSAD